MGGLLLRERKGRRKGKERKGRVGAGRGKKKEKESSPIRDEILRTPLTDAVIAVCNFFYVDAQLFCVRKWYLLCII